MEIKLNSLGILNNSIKTKDGELILDSHKLAYHFSRVEAWEKGEQIAPVSVDMALTRACGAMCSFCYAMVQEPNERASIKTQDALNLLDDFSDLGVKAVSLVSDGESTISKAYVPFIKHAAEVGIDIGNATNGWEFEKEKIDEVLPYMKWIRFTVGAGTPEGYAKIMYKGSEYTEVFDRAISNIRYTVELKKKLNLEVTLGIQMVLTPELEKEIMPFAKLALDLEVDYAVIKHCSDDEFGTLGIDYSKYESMYPMIKKAENLSNEKTKIIAKWNKIKDKGVSSYNRLYGPQFLLQISGTGLVAPSGQFFNARYSKLHVGNFTEERFKDIFKSKRYKRIMDYIASPCFDAQTMMGTLPITHYLNQALDNHLKGVEKIKPSSGPIPLHVNFL
jgi:MoaA/NifB/PqqE/SkfB family radical SAM enzyme